MITCVWVDHFLAIAAGRVSSYVLGMEPGLGMGIGTEDRIDTTVVHLRD